MTREQMLKELKVYVDGINENTDTSPCRRLNIGLLRECVRLIEFDGQRLDPQKIAEHGAIIPYFLHNPIREAVNSQPVPNGIVELMYTKLQAGAEVVKPPKEK